MNQIRTALILIAAAYFGLEARAASTTIILSQPSDPSTFGTAVTLTATVSPTAATGLVTFYDGASVIGGASLTSGTATVTTRFLSTGRHKLRAYYGGKAPYVSSISSNVSLTVSSIPGKGFSAAASILPATAFYR